MAAVGRWFVTPHAVRRYMERIEPGASYEQALAALIRAAEGAHRVRSEPGGVELWRAGRPARLRFRVQPPQPGRLPVLMTVLPEHGDWS